jgi:hypothetical protein
MKTAILLATFICISCKEQRRGGDSDTKTQSQNMSETLIGIWNSDMNHEATKNSIGNVTITFTKDGSFTYDIYEGDKLQRMNMTYHVVGDVIISDQPSHPNEQKTKYKLETNDKLILEFEGVATVFKREINK